MIISNEINPAETLHDKAKGNNCVPPLLSSFMTRLHGTLYRDKCKDCDICLKEFEAWMLDRKCEESAESGAVCLCAPKIYIFIWCSINKNYIENKGAVIHDRVTKRPCAIITPLRKLCHQDLPFLFLSLSIKGLHFDEESRSGVKWIS